MTLVNKIKQFLHWWGEGLKKGLPSALSGLFRTEMPRLVLQMQQSNAFTAQWKQDGRFKHLGDYTLNDGEVALFNKPPKLLRSKKYLVEVQLDPTQGLSLNHNFPEAIEENLSQVVGYQLDRITPFTIDRAYYSARKVAHDKQNKEIEVNVQVIPKQGAKQIMERLSAKGAPEINLVSIAGGEPAIPMGNTTQKDMNQLWSWVPVGFMVVALLVALVGPLAYKIRRVDQIDAALASVRSNAAEQISIREQLTSAQDALQFLDQRRRNMPVALDVVEQLSALLPKNTWVSRLSIEGSQLNLRGESEIALELIDILEEADEFSAVKFSSPVTRSKESGRDKFHIQAEVEVK